MEVLPQQAALLPEPDKGCVGVTLQMLPGPQKSRKHFKETGDEKNEHYVQNYNCNRITGNDRNVLSTRVVYLPDRTAIS